MRKIKHDKQCTISFQKKKKKKEKERNTQPLSDKLLERSQTRKHFLLARLKILLLLSFDKICSRKHNLLYT